MILDTSAYSYFGRGEPGMMQILSATDHIVMPNIVLGELKAGYLRGNQYELNNERLLSFLSRKSVSIICPDERTPDTYAELMAESKGRGVSIGVKDAWIAALAIQHNLALITYDKDFAHLEDIFPKLHLLSPKT